MKITFRPLLQKRRLLLAGGALFLVGLLIWHPVSAHFRAARLVVKMAKIAMLDSPILNTHPPIVETILTFPDPQTGHPIRARLYAPQNVTSGPGMVLIHGVHRLGMDEPRLMAFARAFSTTGLMVLTPEITELADYHISPQSIQTIGTTTQFLSQKLGQSQVGLMGLSFAGGLALLAAGDARYKSSIQYVVSVGGHHDLARVAQFFATNQIPLPDGRIQKLTAHPYGPLIIVYSNLAHFFPPKDLPQAHEILKLWLWEQFDQAKQQLPSLSPDSQKKMGLLFEGKIDQFAPELLKEIESLRSDMKLVSPNGHLQAVSVPVFLLHGELDPVIPVAEAKWLIKEIPPNPGNHVLISKCIGHVELQGEPSFSEVWQLVHFVAEILSRAGKSTRQR